MILAAQTAKINLFAIYEVLLDFYTGCVVEQHNLNRFSWLHISDLGLSDDDQSIPEAQWQALQEDLRLLHPESGPWDAVFLTGDITRTAKTSEYLAATRLLKDRILATLNQLGSS